MLNQVSQYEMFVKMAKAMEQGNNKQLRKIDKLIRRTLYANKKNHDVSNGYLLVDDENASLLQSMKMSVR